MKGNIIRFDYSVLLVRVFLGITVGAHGAQKVLGWFGGYGFDGTMGFFTETIGLPYLVAHSIIALESIGMVALILGLFSRFVSASLIAVMIGAIVTTHSQYGFFMNWEGTQGGEGFEFHMLIIALSAVILIQGAGVLSVDNLLFQKKSDTLKSLFSLSSFRLKV